MQLPWRRDAAPAPALQESVLEEAVEANMLRLAQAYGLVETGWDGAQLEASAIVCALNAQDAEPRTSEAAIEIAAWERLSERYGIPVDRQDVPTLSQLLADQHEQALAKLAAAGETRIAQAEGRLETPWVDAQLAAGAEVEADRAVESGVLTRDEVKAGLSRVDDALGVQVDYAPGQSIEQDLGH